MQAHRVLTLLLATTTFAAVLLGEAPTASAQGEGAAATVLFSSPAVGIMGTVFLVADIAYGAEHRLLPQEWAIAQIIGGLVQLAFATVAVVGIVQESPVSPALGGFAAAGTVLGGWHLAHGIWSLSEPNEREPTTGPPPVQVGFFDGGAFASVGGAF